MEELTFKEKINEAINTALSINYMVLNAYDRAMPEGKMYFDRNDIFNKSRQQRINDEVLKQTAEARMECLYHIGEFINSIGHIEAFKSNSLSFIEYYNKCTGENIQPSEFFTETDVKDLNHLIDLSEKVQYCNISNHEKMEFLFVLSTFLNFYDSYKNWLISRELFDAVTDDVTPYGARSLSYGKPENPAIINIDAKYLQDVLDTYFLFIYKNMKSVEKNANKSMKNAIKSISNIDKQDLEHIENSQLLAMFAESCATLDDRIKASHSLPETKESIFDKIKKFIVGKFEPQTTVEIKNVYVHREELNNLLYLALNFPELNDITIDLMQKYFDEKLAEELLKSLNNNKDTPDNS